MKKTIVILFIVLLQNNLISAAEGIIAGMTALTPPKFKTRSFIFFK